MSATSDPYIEQVVLLDGQGIWYSTPNRTRYADCVNSLNAMREERLTTWLVGLLWHWIGPTMASDAMQPSTSVRKTCSSSTHCSTKYLLRSCGKLVQRFCCAHIPSLIRACSRDAQAVLVLTKGQRSAWNIALTKRLEQSLGNLFSKVVFIPRVPPQDYVALLKMADVILHPFPFGGSKTAADAILANVPMVVLPTEYLRYGMG